MVHPVPMVTALWAEGYTALRASLREGSVPEGADGGEPEGRRAPPGRGPVQAPRLRPEGILAHEVVPPRRA
ncbi:hypothetical protein GCM10019016_121310 [Streptomyces prasinosporus]|uniref:Uncharacterized protein n=1 Tax=Streptomyces prasinosporus TaxID=68256 RepID=A0ABP6UE87_9ACTN